MVASGDLRESKESGVQRETIKARVDGAAARSGVAQRSGNPLNSAHPSREERKLRKHAPAIVHLQHS